MNLHEKPIFSNGSSGIVENHDQAVMAFSKYKKNNSNSAWSGDYPLFLYIKPSSTP
jgi:hypothetical protein